MGSIELRSPTCNPLVLAELYGNPGVAAMSRQGVMSFLQKLAVDETLQVKLNNSIKGKTGAGRLEAVVQYAKTLDCEFTAREYGSTCETNHIATSLLSNLNAAGGSEWDTKLPPKETEEEDGR